jgi:hypothetical protein
MRLREQERFVRIRSTHKVLVGSGERESVICSKNLRWRVGKLLSTEYLQLNDNRWGKGTEMRMLRIQLQCKMPAPCPCWLLELLQLSFFRSGAQRIDDLDLHLWRTMTSKLRVRERAVGAHRVD